MYEESHSVGVKYPNSDNEKYDKIVYVASHSHISPQYGFIVPQNLGKECKVTLAGLPGFKLVHGGYYYDFQENVSYSSGDYMFDLGFKIKDLNEELNSISTYMFVLNPGENIPDIRKLGYTGEDWWKRIEILRSYVKANGGDLRKSYSQEKINKLCNLYDHPMIVDGIIFNMSNLCFWMNVHYPGKRWKIVFGSCLDIDRNKCSCPFVIDEFKIFDKGGDYRYYQNMMLSQKFTDFVLKEILGIDNKFKQKLDFNSGVGIRNMFKIPQGSRLNTYISSNIRKIFENLPKSEGNYSLVAIQVNDGKEYFVFSNNEITSIKIINIMEDIDIVNIINNDTYKIGTSKFQKFIQEFKKYKSIELAFSNIRGVLMNYENKFSTKKEAEKDIKNILNGLHNILLKSKKEFPELFHFIESFNKNPDLSSIDNLNQTIHQDKFPEADTFYTDYKDKTLQEIMGFIGSYLKEIKIHYNDYDEFDRNTKKIDNIYIYKYYPRRNLIEEAHESGEVINIDKMRSLRGLHTHRIIKDQRTRLSDKNALFRGFIPKFIKRFRQNNHIISKEQLDILEARLLDVCSYDVFVIPYELICILWGKGQNKEHSIYRKGIDTDTVVWSIYRMLVDGTSSQPNRHTHFEKYLTSGGVWKEG